MTGLVDAAGTMGESVAWARAAEPTAGEAHAGAHGETCLNCGAALVGRYCHACGQSAHVHRTLLSIVHDLAHGVFHFEGKIWRTVPMLVLHPGQLTRRYIAGERARFVSPLALFLFTVFLMFATFSALSGDVTKQVADGWSNSTAALDKARARTAEEIAATARERARLIAARQPTAAMDRRLAKLRSDAADLARVRYRVEASTSDSFNVNSRSGWLNQRIEAVRENPGLVLYKVQSAAYKFSWALIFLSTPLVALLFLWRRRFGLYDHATFVTYSTSFMSLLAVAADVALAVGAPGGAVALLVLLAAPAHMFAQLRGAYGLRAFSALWRTVALLFFSASALLLFVLGVVALEVAH